MDTLNLVSQNLDTLIDSVSVLTDTANLNIHELSGESISNLSLEIIDIVKTVIFIVIGALISKFFSEYRKNKRLIKLYEYLNLVLKSLINRVEKYAEKFNELIQNLDDPENKDFIPPSFPGVETEIINSIGKEDLFEIFLIRLKSDNEDKAKKDFLFLLNTIKYFETIFSQVQIESKSTVDSIVKTIDKLIELHLELTQTVTTFQFDLEVDDDFTHNIAETWKNFISVNGGKEIRNFNTYETELIQKLNGITQYFAIEKNDPRAFNLAMLLVRMIQEIEMLKTRKNSLKDFLEVQTKYLKSENDKFLETAEKFNTFSFKKWITIGFGKINRDKDVFKKLIAKKEKEKETNA
jgi:hypothetical protein